MADLVTGDLTNALVHLAFDNDQPTPSTHPRALAIELISILIVRTLHHPSFNDLEFHPHRRDLADTIIPNVEPDSLWPSFLDHPSNPTRSPPLKEDYWLTLSRTDTHRLIAQSAILTLDMARRRNAGFLVPGRSHTLPFTEADVKRARQCAERVNVRQDAPSAAEVYEWIVGLGSGGVSRPVKGNGRGRGKGRKDVSARENGASVTPKKVVKEVPIGRPHPRLRKFGKEFFLVSRGEESGGEVEDVLDDDIVGMLMHGMRDQGRGKKTEVEQGGVRPTEEVDVDAEPPEGVTDDDLSEDEEPATDHGRSEHESEVREPPFTDQTSNVVSPTVVPTPIVTAPGIADVCMEQISTVAQSSDSIASPPAHRKSETRIDHITVPDMSLVFPFDDELQTPPAEDFEAVLRSLVGEELARVENDPEFMLPETATPADETLVETVAVAVADSQSSARQISPSPAVPVADLGPSTAVPNVVATESDRDEDEEYENAHIPPYSVVVSPATNATLPAQDQPQERIWKRKHEKQPQLVTAADWFQQGVKHYLMEVDRDRPSESQMHEWIRTRAAQLEVDGNQTTVIPFSPPATPTGTQRVSNSKIILRVGKRKGTVGEVEEGKACVSKKHKSKGLGRDGVDDEREITVPPFSPPATPTGTQRGSNSKIILRVGKRKEGVGEVEEGKGAKKHKSTGLGRDGVKDETETTVTHVSPPATPTTTQRGSTSKIILRMEKRKRDVGEVEEGKCASVSNKHQSTGLGRDRVDDQMVPVEAPEDGERSTRETLVHTPVVPQSAGMQLHEAESMNERLRSTTQEAVPQHVRTVGTAPTALLDRASQQDGDRIWDTESTTVTSHPTKEKDAGTTPTNQQQQQHCSRRLPVTFEADPFFRPTQAHPASPHHKHQPQHNQGHSLQSAPTYPTAHDFQYPQQYQHYFESFMHQYHQQCQHSWFMHQYHQQYQHSFESFMQLAAAYPTANAPQLYQHQQPLHNHGPSLQPATAFPPSTDSPGRPTSKPMIQDPQQGSPKTSHQILVPSVNHQQQPQQQQQPHQQHPQQPHQQQQQQQHQQAGPYASADQMPGGAPAGSHLLSNPNPFFCPTHQLHHLYSMDRARS
ncbi:hypothetical protein HK104_008763 [Borealophlyctis nickersoniae]|nr:hypothetical protein HK104_008763 [Borealophlyctis nickersoniae]